MLAKKCFPTVFLNLNYTNGGIAAGVRFEGYMNPIKGIDSRYEGYGLSYRYVSYADDFFKVTVGDFYEQFGSGLILRAYEERSLGIDNAIEGFNVKVTPMAGLSVTGLIGKQRYFWDKGEGIVRAGDVNLSVNEAIQGLMPEDLNLSLGASYVSKYQKASDPIYNLPENVSAFSARFALNASDFNFDAEFANKINDPSAVNKNTYNNGYGWIVNGAYFQKGWSIAFNAHKIDNMDFRSDRNATGNSLFINYIPPLTKQHTYKLASLFPYSTKLTGEVGFQADANVKLPAGSLLGGQYGTSINLNYSTVYSIDTTHTNVDPVSKVVYKYDSPIFGMGDRQFYQDFNISISHKFSSKFKGSITGVFVTADRDIIENEGSPKYGKVTANSIIVDGTYRITDNHAVRVELQNMFFNQDSVIHYPDNRTGDRFFALVEYSISPRWFFSVADEYNYGNDFEERRLHYPTASITMIEGTTRIQASYGRQNGGILCVGGVCRTVPSSNGLYLSVSKSF